MPTLPPPLSNPASCHTLPRNARGTQPKPLSRSLRDTISTGSVCLTSERFVLLGRALPCVHSHWHDAFRLYHALRLVSRYSGGREKLSRYHGTWLVFLFVVAFFAHPIFYF